MSTTESIEAESSEEFGDEPTAMGASVRAAIERLQDHANVRAVYGDPVELEGKTILPVARVAYGFGGGFGSSEESDEVGEGGGGGVSARPTGVVEITEDETRFIRFTDWKRLAGAAVGGAVLGYLLGRR